VRKRFNASVDAIIKALGSPSALLVAALVIVVWAITGPIFHFSDTWQLVINTGTTIVTFLMVFVIQNGQNRDSKAVHIKLDELIRAVEGARDRMALAELETDEEQERDIQELVRLAHESEPGSATALAAADVAESEARKAKGAADKAHEATHSLRSRRSSGRPPGAPRSPGGSPSKKRDR
jgi:low affinity Fe/Cu permease